MKKFVFQHSAFLSSFLLLLFFITGCSPDDDPIENISNDETNPIETNVFTISNFELLEKTSYSLKFSGVLGGDRTQLLRTGLVYSTSNSTPSILTSEMSENVVFGSNGVFNTILENLEQATTYYVRFFIETTDNEVLYSNAVESRTFGWSRVNDFPGSLRAWPGYFTIAQKGYVFNGIENTNDMWEYDNDTDEWNKISNSGFPRPTEELNMPAHSFTINVGFGNYGYAGIYRNNTTIGTDYFKNQDFYRFDPTDNTWTQLPSFPEKYCQDCGSYILDGQFIVVKGYNSYPEPPFYNPYFYEYRFNLVTLQWSLHSAYYYVNGNGEPYNSANSHFATLNNQGYIYSDLYGSDSDALYIASSSDPANLIGYNTEINLDLIIASFTVPTSNYGFGAVFIDKYGRSVACDLDNNLWTQIISFPVNDIYYGSFIFDFDYDKVMIGLGIRVNDGGYTPKIFLLEK